MSTSRRSASRLTTDRANSRHSTGPRTDSGKQRSSQNALRHGLTAASAVLATEAHRGAGAPRSSKVCLPAHSLWATYLEDRAAYDAHCRGFFDEYQPATPTETHLTQELADTA